MPAIRHPHRIGRRVLRRLVQHRRDLIERRRQRDAHEGFEISFEEAHNHRQPVPREEVPPVD